MSHVFTHTRNNFRKTLKWKWLFTKTEIESNRIEHWIIQNDLSFGLTRNTFVVTLGILVFDCLALFFVLFSSFSFEPKILVRFLFLSGYMDRCGKEPWEEPEISQLYSFSAIKLELSSRKNIRIHLKNTHTQRVRMRNFCKLLIKILCLCQSTIFWHSKHS